MNTLLYRIGTSAYHAAIRLGALVGVERAKLWVDGREKAPPLPDSITRRNGSPLLWMHCASLGEWEQGRPVLEAFRKKQPQYRAILTFFSPSGYERCQDDPAVDHVAYLPPDSPEKAAEWIRKIAPSVAVFVKYEFWYFHLQALHNAKVPTFLVAANFRPEQPFFNPAGDWWRGMLRYFESIVVQQPESVKLLTGLGKYPDNRVFIAGDPRMDRTLELADRAFSDPIIEAFTEGDDLTIVAGSVWPEDLRALAEAWAAMPPNVRIILAPHQLKSQELARTQVLWKAKRYTESTPEDLVGARVLLLDTIGMLSRVYRFGDLAYVGGAFRTGLHNTLEPLAYGLPCVFGPEHQKFPEAAAAISAGGAFSVENGRELSEVMGRLLDPEERKRAATAQVELGKKWAGAGGRTASFIQERLALSSGQ